MALDASGSRSLRGELTRARWSTQTAVGCLSAEGVHATIALPVGLHTITLEVENELGQHDTDTLLVRVARP